MEKKNMDRKFAAGMALLTAMVLFLMAGFWTTVIRQAKIDKAMETEEVLSARRGICLQLGEDLKTQVFWDMDEAVCFTARTPAGIYNRNGVFIKGDVLDYGDMVRFYGGELAGEAEIKELTGFSKMERVGRATLEEASRYQEEMEAALPEGVLR